MAVTKSMSAWRAPGRVNLIGEHTDYNDGYVMPIAIELQSEVRTEALEQPELRAWSQEMGAEAGWPLEAIGALRPQGNWTDYVVGVAQELLRLGYELRPMRLRIHSTVPVGSGLSSSAALEVSSALALLDGRQIDRLELALLCQRAERNFVGMPCGIMDQYVSVFGVSGSAVRIDCRTLTHEAVPLPKDVAVIAVNSMVKHDLGKSEYPLRVKQCQEALAYFPGKKALRDVSVDELDAATSRIPDIPCARAHHVVNENWRVERFSEAARAGDVQRMGKLFVDSHRSLQHDYEVSSEELDFLVDSAIHIMGCYGARMTGGGFGGCTVNLVSRDSERFFASAISVAYEQRYNIKPDIYFCHPAAGAGEL